MTKKKHRIQLQAKNTSEARVQSLTVDDTVENYLKILHEFNEKLLNMEVSTSILFRRAIELYFYHICDIWPKVMKAYNRKDDLEATHKLAELLELERECLYSSANRLAEYRKGQSKIGGK